MTLGEQCAVMLQMCLYGFAQTFNLLTDVGIFVDTSKILPNCDELISQNLTNEVGESLRCSGGNYTSSVLDQSKTDIRILQLTLAAFFLLGGVLFLTQIFLYFKYLVAVGSPTFEHDIDDSPFLQRFYKIHGVLLALEAVVHDLPAGLIVIELCVLVWRTPNCWECVAIFSSGATDEASLSKTNLWLGIKLASLAPITFYKGRSFTRTCTSRVVNLNVSQNVYNAQGRRNWGGGGGRRGSCPLAFCWEGQGQGGQKCPLSTKNII